jgi:hypothetical protein
MANSACLPAYLREPQNRKGEHANVDMMRVEVIDDLPIPVGHLSTIGDKSTMKTSHEELLKVLSELSGLLPEWRFGQLVANVATAARGPKVEASWDSDDEELLAAARRLIERNRYRAQVAAEPSRYN